MSEFNDKTISMHELEEMVIAACGSINGSDTEDNSYTSISKLWKKELKHNQSKGGRKGNPMDTPWYRNAYSYWENEANCPLSDDGVLGGYGKLTPLDVRDSNMFLDNLSKMFTELKFNVAADCGAGIGRVSKHLLCHRFQHVHLIEQSPRLLAAAPGYIGDPDASRITCIVEGLQVSAISCIAVSCVLVTQEEISDHADFPFIFRILSPNRIALILYGSSG